MGGTGTGTVATGASISASELGTYAGNAYGILSQVRLGINEHSAALVQGTDTTGAFKNEELMRHINNSQYHIWSIIFEQFPEYFLTSASLAFTSSVATLPSDLFKIRDVSDSDGYSVNPISISQRHIASDTGSSHDYYRYGNTLRIDADDVTDTGTLWYYSRCRELDMGLTSAGGAASATLATTAKAIADYYNGMKIENMTDATVDTITDYSAARVCTVSNTWAASKYYGIVSDLPEIFQPLIAEYAILQLKKSPKVPLQVSVADIQLFNEMLRSYMKSFAGTLNTDTYIGNIVNDFESF
jgi:hypothetical protein